MAEGLERVYVSHWLKTGWSAYRGNFGPLALAAALISAFEWILALASPTSPALSEELADGDAPVFVIVFIAMLLRLLVCFPLYVGWFYLCLRAARGERVRFRSLFCGFGRYWPSIGVVLLLGLIVVGAAVGILVAITVVTFLAGPRIGPPILLILSWLMICAAVWLWATYGLAPYAVLDRSAGPAEALRHSARVTRGHRSALAGLFIYTLVMAALYAPMWLLLGSGAEGDLLSVHMPPAMSPVAIVLAALAVLVATPWLGGCQAAAYDELTRLGDEGGAEEAHDIAAGIADAIGEAVAGDAAEHPPAEG